VPTHPGTEINETPEIDAPIMPNATKYQGDFRFPIKNVELLAFFPVTYEIPYRAKK
jgi:hypothetical protein